VSINKIRAEKLFLDTTIIKRTHYYLPSAFSRYEVNGSLKVGSNSLDFIVAPNCYDYGFTPFNKIVEFFVPCHNEVFKDIRIDFKNIKKISRRSYLLIWPNILRIKTDQNKVYKFKIWKRKAIIDRIKSYKETH
jgi:hypothetical protein